MAPSASGVAQGRQVLIAHWSAALARRKCLCAEDQCTAKSCGSARHGQPVRTTDRIASRYSRQRCSGQGRPRSRAGTRCGRTRDQAGSDRSDG